MVSDPGPPLLRVRGEAEDSGEFLYSTPRNSQQDGDFALAETRRPFKNPLLADEIIHHVIRREHF